MTEFVRGGDLLFHMQRERVLTVDRTRFYGAEIILGIEYLHKLGIIYRDLKVSKRFMNALFSYALISLKFSHNGAILILCSSFYF